MGQRLNICEGTFWLKIADSIAILVKIFSILMLDQLSQCRKMRPELAHLRKSQAGLYKPFFRSYSSLKVIINTNFANGTS